MLESKSQLGQDLAALVVNRFEPGFFVEFGATNGKSLSNTWLLEKRFGWNGILAEPQHAFRSQLISNRSCAIDFRAIHSVSGKFMEIEGNGETARAKISSNLNSQNLVETVSLHDLLSQHQAPRYIDFLSVDIEGGEFKVLKVFPFEKYSFGLVAVEHNYSEHRDDLRKLLVANGYLRIDVDTKWDDWYVKDPK
jgi:FkbM family methyltransferase